MFTCHSVDHFTKETWEPSEHEIDMPNVFYLAVVLCFIIKVTTSLIKVMWYHITCFTTEDAGQKYEVIYHWYDVI